MPSHNNNNNQGFALLMAIVVVGVVISISLSVLDLTIKQLRLSTNSKDSEVAFSAANAGLECARYWRIANDVKFETGDTSTTISCFGVSASYTKTNPDATSFLYTFAPIPWGSSGSERCTKISMLIMVSPINSDSSLVTMTTIFPGYPYGATKNCEAGGRCTVISIQGFNKTCSAIGNEGTVQREVLLEL